MFVFKSIANQLTTNKINSYTQKVMDYDFVKDWILKDIKKRTDTGVTANNEELQTDIAMLTRSGVYSFYTQKQKLAKNQKVTEVTLKDTGEFYNSFKIDVNKTFYSIFANFNKDNSNIYDNFNLSFSTFDEFKSSILNMSEKSTKIFYEKIFIPEFNAIVLHSILNR